MAMEKILIIDDEPAIVELVEAKLRTSGYETLVATDGRAGIEAARALNPGLILLDILMPEIDGFEVCRRLKADKETIGIPIIFLSGKLLERDVVKGLELGAEDYIIKPFSPRELVARVKHILDSKAAPKQTRSAPFLAHLEQKIEALSALQNVSAAMNAMRDLDELRQYILEQALDVARAKTGSLMILDPDGDLRIANARGLNRKIIEQTRIKRGEGISGSVASIGEPLLITNIEEDNRFRRPSDVKYETRSLVCVPLKVRDKTIGVLNVNNKESGDIFNQDDLEILTLLANQAAVATENADLYKRMEANLAEYKSLRTAIDTALEGHSLAEMFKGLLNQATDITEGTVGLLWLNDETTDELYIASTVGRLTDELSGIRVPLGKGVLGKAAKSNQALIVNDWNGQDDSLRALNNLIGQPLTADSTLLGFITIADKARGARFDPEDLSSLRGLSTEMVSVLYTSRVVSAQNAKEEPCRAGSSPDKISEFCSVVAHELREPLTSICGFSEMLIDSTGEEDREAKRYLEVINREATRMSKLIEDLLNISKLETGQFALDLRPVSLAEVVAETLDKMTQLSPYKVETEIPADLSPAIVDRDKISQILINLLNNAANYSKPDQPIKIAVAEEPDQFIVSVTDSGIGIASEDQKRVFNKFFRADVPLNKEVGGTGLGLAIVRYLARQQSGKVGVTSTPGEGSTFWFTLPKGINQHT